MSTLDQLFQSLRADGKKAFMPFVTAGDPDLAFTDAVLRRLAECGCTMCEVGIPYSDPIADGPVIQASYTRVLNNHVTLPQILNTLTGVASDIAMPMVTMVSYAIVHRYGPERYVQDAKAAGACGAIVPDLLVEESASFAEICKREDFSLIMLVTPTTPFERQLRIADASSGFLYFVSVTGITGERRELPPELVENVSRLRDKIELPVCIGFGISEPEHVRKLSPVADGLIVGSALVRRIEKAKDQPREQVLDDVGDYVKSLMNAINDG